MHLIRAAEVAGWCCCGGAGGFERLEGIGGIKEEEEGGETLTSS